MRENAGANSTLWYDFEHTLVHFDLSSFTTVERTQNLDVNDVDIPNHLLVLYQGGKRSLFLSLQNYDASLTESTFQFQLVKRNLSSPQPILSTRAFSSFEEFRSSEGSSLLLIKKPFVSMPPHSFVCNSTRSYVVVL
ncbi:uncharacterized protein G2W53_028991 [Senna tora]|uniref:Uncharacterized protein n=1 Tax=Senna tora TaxID=362788 RepID=A0A834T4D7_9FABA|nr:uncharacterized protein G2W53_028991 [Senna tora]